MKLKHLSIILTALTLSACCLAGCESNEKKDDRKQININEYVTYEVDGIDSKGYCDIYIDYEKMIEDNYRAFGLKKDHTADDVAELALKIHSSIEGEVDKKDNLSNGDEIKFSWDDSEFKDIEKEYSIKFKYSDIKWEISGLEEAAEIDPFDGRLQVTFSGTAPNGKLDMKVAKVPTVAGAPTYDFEYEADKKTGLKNGDVVTISIIDSDEDIASAGCFVSQRSKEYTVEGLNYYAEKFADIPKQDIGIMDGHNRDLLNADIASSWAEEEKLNNIELINYYLLTGKDGISVSTNNYLYFIYKVDVENAEGAFTYYYYTYYPDVLLTSDGKCSYDLNDAIVPKGSMLFGNVSGEAYKTGKNYYLGYEKLEDLYNKHVTTKVAEYNCEEIEADNLEALAAAQDAADADSAQAAIDAMLDPDKEVTTKSFQEIRDEYHEDILKQAEEQKNQN